MNLWIFSYLNGFLNRLFIVYLWIYEFMNFYLFKRFFKPLFIGRLYILERIWFSNSILFDPLISIDNE